MILIKFCEFIVHSKPNNMTLLAFSEKSLKLEKWLLIFCLAPKPTDQSCSNSLSGVPLQISPACFFVFELPSKLRVVHIRKKFKISIFSKMAVSIFSKMALTLLFKFCVLIVHSKPNNMILSAFPGKILETRKIVFTFLPVT